MSKWAEGYVADIPYALGFYRETVPAHIAFAAIGVGAHPGLSLRPKRVLELGIGMGLGFIINAAANPNTHFEGVDFNPLHIAHANGLASEANLDNVKLREASFQDLNFEAVEGQHDLDMIVLHGILTWVSEEAHVAIVEIARKRLKPAGIVYVSYNCMPGWAPVLPMQRLMRENAKRVFGRSDVQTGAGIKLIKELIQEGAAFFSANPLLGERLRRMESLDKSYLAHEYLNANWHIFHFADVAQMFSRAKLSFVGSATVIENIDKLSVPEKTCARIASETDPVFKETLRDISSNKQFRRDLFGRGVLSANPTEQINILGKMRFILAVPRGKVVFKVPSPLGELDGNPEIYGAVVDKLANGPVRFSELASLQVFQQGGPGATLQTLALLIHSGQVLPMPIDAGDVAPAQRLNRVLVEKMLQGRFYSFLAAPVAGSGVQASHTDLLMLSAVMAGYADDPDAAKEYVIATMKRLGINWMRDGKPIDDVIERDAAIHAGIVEFLNEKLPLWRQLGII